MGICVSVGLSQYTLFVEAGLRSPTRARSTQDLALALRSHLLPIYILTTSSPLY